MKGLSRQEKFHFRRELCDKYSGRCAYCEAYIGKRGTIDHYLPRALGGTDHYENLRWSCFNCNQLKGNAPPGEWETMKPPSRRFETRYEKRIRLLAGIAQRGETDLKWVAAFLLLFSLFVFGMTQIAKKVHSDEHIRCIEGFKFYRQTQIRDDQGRAIRCEGVRPPAAKPRT